MAGTDLQPHLLFVDKRTKRKVFHEDPDMSSAALMGYFQRADVR